MQEPSLSQIPPEDILKRIENLRKADLKTSQIDDLIPLAKILLNGFPFINSYLPLKTVFRARKDKGIGAIQTPFSNVRELWYPPKEKIENYGRLNNIGEQLFYCSNNQDTALLEVRPNEGDVVTIVECQLHNDDCPKTVLWGMVEYAYQNHRDRDMASVRRKFCATKQAEENYLTINSYLEEEFTKIVNAGDEYQYKSSIAISGVLLTGKLQMLDDGHSELLETDGICYESIAWNQGLNLALKPESADRLYRVKTCRMLLVTAKSSENYKWQLITESKGIELDGTIVWDQGLLCLYRGVAKAGQQDYAGAEEDFALAILNGARSSLVHLHRGRSEFDQGNYAEAEGSFALGIDDDPHDPELFFHKGSALYKQGKYAEAAIDLRQATKLGFNGDLESVIRFCESQI